MRVREVMARPPDLELIPQGHAVPPSAGFDDIGQGVGRGAESFTSLPLN